MRFFKQLALGATFVGALAFTGCVEDICAQFNPLAFPFLADLCGNPPE